MKESTNSIVAVNFRPVTVAGSPFTRTRQPSSPGNQPIPPLAQAFSDLDEARGYATEGGYRIYEADIRVALAWAQRAAGHPAAAQTSAARARRLSDEMGYHWGLVDAEEFLMTIT